MWPYGVATPARVVEVVLHIEFHFELACRAGLGDTRMTQQAGWPGRISGYARMRTQLFVTFFLVALEAVITRVPRRSVSQESRVMKTVLLCWMLTLVSDIVASRADHLSIFQGCIEFLTKVLRADRDVGCVPTRKRATTIAMAGFAQCLGVAFV